MCIYIQNSSDNNQTLCILIPTAHQKFDVSSRNQVKDCPGLQQEEFCGFLSGMLSFLLFEVKIPNESQ